MEQKAAVSVNRLRDPDQSALAGTRVLPRKLPRFIASSSESTSENFTF